MWNEYEAGDTIIVDVETNTETGEVEIVLRKAERVPDAVPVDGDGKPAPIE